MFICYFIIYLSHSLCDLATQLIVFLVLKLILSCVSKFLNPTPSPYKYFSHPISSSTSTPPSEEALDVDFFSMTSQLFFFESFRTTLIVIT